jgi:hypothetical protein
MRCWLWWISHDAQLMSRVDLCKMLMVVMLTVMVCGVVVWWCCGVRLWVLDRPNSTNSAIFILASICWCLDTSVHAIDEWARCLLVWSLLARDLYLSEQLVISSASWWLSTVVITYFLAATCILGFGVFCDVCRYPKNKRKRRKERNYLVLAIFSFSLFLFTFVIFSLLYYLNCNILLIQNNVKTVYLVLIINKVQVFLPIKCLSFLNVYFKFKFKFHNLKLNLNSLFMFRVCLFKFTPSPHSRDQKRSCQILSHFENVPSPLEERFDPP